MSFSRPSLSGIIDRTQADLASRLGTGPLLPRSVLSVLGRVYAGASHLLHGHLDWVSRQLFPDTADEEHLERWASIWAVRRKVATTATGNVTLTGTNGSVVPVGTKMQRTDGMTYTTTAEGTVSSGTVTVAVAAEAVGAAGNLAASQAVTLVSPVSGVNVSGTVAAGGLTGGTDQETDDALRARLLERIKQPPHGGADFDYKAWALEVPGVTRAWVYPLYLGAGTVGVTFVMDDQEGGIIPSGDMVDEVQDYIDARRPVTADVTVFAPVAAALNLTIHLAPDTSTIRAAVQAELTDLLRREAVPGGTILISHIREAMSVAAGENDHTLTSPSANVTHTAGHIAVMGTITWT